MGKGFERSFCCIFFANALDTGKNWSVSGYVKDAESILHFKKILWHPEMGKTGLGYTPKEHISMERSEEFRKAVSDTISNVHDQIQLSSKASLIELDRLE